MINYYKKNQQKCFCIVNGLSLQNDEKDGEENEKIVTEMMENLDSFVLEPAPQVRFLSAFNFSFYRILQFQGALVKCRITRDRKGMDRGISMIINNVVAKKLCISK